MSSENKDLSQQCQGCAKPSDTLSRDLNSVTGALRGWFHHMDGASMYPYPCTNGNLLEGAYQMGISQGIKAQKDQGCPDCLEASKNPESSVIWRSSAGDNKWYHKVGLSEDMHMCSNSRTLEACYREGLTGYRRDATVRGAAVLTDRDSDTISKATAMLDSAGIGSGLPLDQRVSILIDREVDRERDKTLHDKEVVGFLNLEVPCTSSYFLEEDAYQRGVSQGLMDGNRAQAAQRSRDLASLDQMTQKAAKLEKDVVGFREYIESVKDALQLAGIARHGLLLVMVKRLIEREEESKNKLRERGNKEKLSENLQDVITSIRDLIEQAGIERHSLTVIMVKRLIDRDTENRKTLGDLRASQMEDRDIFWSIQRIVSKRLTKMVDPGDTGSDTPPDTPKV